MSVGDETSDDLLRWLAHGFEGRQRRGDDAQGVAGGDDKSDRAPGNADEGFAEVTTDAHVDVGG